MSSSYRRAIKRRALRRLLWEIDPWHVGATRSSALFACGVSVVVVLGWAAGRDLAGQVVIGLGLGGLGALAWRTHAITLERHQQEMRELWALMLAIGDRRPWLPAGGWALGADALLFAIRETAARGLLMTVELGPGCSSVVLKRMFPAMEVYGVEHDPAFLQQMERFVDWHNMSGYQLVHADLVEGWYDKAALEILPSQIDLLIIDGPPNGRGDGARHPGLRHFCGRMKRGGLVLIDDTHRADERKLAMEWATLDEFRIVHDGGSFVALEACEV